MRKQRRDANYMKAVLSLDSCDPKLFESYAGGSWRWGPDCHYGETDVTKMSLLELWAQYCVGFCLVMSSAIAIALLGRGDCSAVIGLLPFGLSVVSV
jgi:hypothetical protein